MKNAFFYDTEIGAITIAENGTEVTDIYFGKEISPDFDVKETQLIRDTYVQICEYLKGERKTFDVPLFTGGTDFQKRVWKALEDIPYGETRSYQDIAKAAGNVKACRAVGMANNKNPISIIIPCHRVIGKNGKLVGYGGGLNIKEYLLKLEGGLRIE